MDVHANHLHCLFCIDAIVAEGASSSALSFHTGKRASFCRRELESQSVDDVGACGEFFFGRIKAATNKIK
jgi:hypothetical protein